MELLNRYRDRVLIAYHGGGCIDGFTSAVILMEALTEAGLDYETIAMSYTEDSYKKLIDFAKTYEPNFIEVVDFSLPYDTVDELSNIPHFSRGYITDHHKTAFERYAKGMEVNEYSILKSVIRPQWDVLLDNGHSGASLIAKDLMDRECMPEEVLTKYANLIAYVKDYDLWKFNHGDETRWVHHYLVNRPQTLTSWSITATSLNSEEGRTEVFKVGAMHKSIHDEEVAKAVKRAYRFNLDGYTGLITGVESPTLISEVGSELAKKTGTFGIVIPYFDHTAEAYEPDKLIAWSLRSNGKFDVSELAAKFGGGGHKGAAGFTQSMQVTLDAIMKEELHP